LNCTKQDVFIPKADAMKDGVIKRVDTLKGALIEKLKNAGAEKFHLALDAWTSSNCYNFLAITCTFIDKNWQLCEELLSFEDLYDHSGDGKAAVVLEALHNSQITDKIGCITADNARNNDTLCFALSELLNHRYVSDANLIGKTEF
jgi:hypothetical protein